MGFNCLLIYMVVMAILKAIDDSLSIIWNPELIPRILNSVVNYVKDCIIQLSLLFFIAVVRIAL